MNQENTKNRLVCSGIDHDIARTSVSRTVRIGLAMISLSLFLISLLALFSFYSFKVVLAGLSNEAIPQIIQNSSTMNKFDGLLIETERLASASSISSRRIAYKNIQSSLAEIHRSLDGNTAVTEALNNELFILENVLNELNDLVAEKILINKQNRAKLSTLFKLSEDVVAFEAYYHSKHVGHEERAVITEWVRVAFHMLTYSGKSSSITTLYKLKRVESVLKKELISLGEISNRIPLKHRKDIQQLEQRIRADLLGRGGLMELMRARAKISMDSANRGHFTKKLVNDVKATQTSIFNRLIDDAAGTTVQLDHRVENIAFVLFGLLVSATFTVAWTVIYFRRNLVQRLVNLNAAILDRVAGQGAFIKETRNDEITDMTRSFIYYEKVVSSREAELEQLAMKDPLTGLSNRRHFIEKLFSEIKRSSRKGHEFGLLMLDIDYFKRINDTYGHHAGDIVLDNFGQLFTDIVREVDIVGRIGGRSLLCSYRKQINKIP